jgi:hypothetical protein
MVIQTSFHFIHPVTVEYLLQQSFMLAIINCKTWITFLLQSLQELYFCIKMCYSGSSKKQIPIGIRYAGIHWGQTLMGENEMGGDKGGEPSD